MATLYAFATPLADLLPLAHWNDDDGPGWIFGLVFWLAVITILILLLRGRGWFGNGPDSHDRESGTQILDRRFAEGEMDAEEYRERRSVLDRSKPT